MDGIAVERDVDFACFVVLNSLEGNVEFDFVGSVYELQLVEQRSGSGDLEDFLDLRLYDLNWFVVLDLEDLSRRQSF